MIARLSIAGLCLLIAWAPANIRAQVNAEDRTQSLLDTHKDMDPVNPDRSLTSRTRKQETHIETSPLPPAPQKETAERKKTLKRIRQLKQEKREFINKQVRADKETAAAAGRFMALDNTKKADPAKTWDESPKGQILRKLEQAERERPKTSAKTEAKISTAPLPPRTY